MAEVPENMVRNDCQSVNNENDSGNQFFMNHKLDKLELNFEIFILTGNSQKPGVYCRATTKGR